jgi:hypothetical protein
MAKKMKLVVTLRSLRNAGLPFLILPSPILPTELKANGVGMGA